MLEVCHLCFVTPETTPSSSLWPGEKRNAVEVSKNNILSRPGWYGWKVSHNCEVSIDDYWSFLMTCCVSVAAEYLFIMDGLRVVLWDAAADVADGGGRDWQYGVNSNGKISLLCEPGRSSCTVYTQQCSDVCLIKKTEQPYRASWSYLLHSQCRLHSFSHFILFCRRHSHSDLHSC